MRKILISHEHQVMSCGKEISGCRFFLLHVHNFNCGMKIKVAQLQGCSQFSWLVFLEGSTLQQDVTLKDSQLLAYQILPQYL